MDNNQHNPANDQNNTTSQTTAVSQSTPNNSNTRNDQMPNYSGYPMMQTAENKVVGVGAFFGLMFLFSLPFIGWIACIIAAFAPENKNIKNYARAILLWILVGIVLAVIGIVFLAGAGHAIGSSLMNSTQYF